MSKRDRLLGEKVKMEKVLQDKAASEAKQIEAKTRLRWIKAMLGGDNNG